ncbi:hypothetical protein TNCV_2002351 [Trichonephila clavipes]|nr:hypothetical protein TNCV_2002351 [Trichonephila clavipes]
MSVQRFLKLVEALELLNSLDSDESDVVIAVFPLDASELTKRRMKYRRDYCKRCPWVSGGILLLRLPSHQTTPIHSPSNLSDRLGFGFVISRSNKTRFASRQTKPVQSTVIRQVRFSSPAAIS